MLRRAVCHVQSGTTPRQYPYQNALFFRTRADATSVLEVSSHASPKEIKDAFRKQALRWHPDRPNGCQVTFVKMQNAFLALQDVDSLRADQIQQQQQQRYSRRTHPAYGSTNESSDGWFDRWYHRDAHSESPQPAADWFDKWFDEWSREQLRGQDTQQEQSQEQKAEDVKYRFIVAAAKLLAAFLVLRVGAISVAPYLPNVLPQFQSDDQQKARHHAMEQWASPASHDNNED